MVFFWGGGSVRGYILHLFFDKNNTDIFYDNRSKYTYIHWVDGNCRYIYVVANR